MDIEGAGMSGRATMIWWVLLLPCVFVRPSEALPISGRVVDYRARPVAGAEVALYEELHDHSADRDVVRLQDRITSTDPNGRFAFTANIAPSYRVFLVARKQGLALGWDVLLQAEGNVIVLERPCVLAGAVVDAAGRPVAAAKVRAVPKSSYLRRLEQRPILGPEPWLAVRTDRQGTFRFDSFAADVSADFWVRAPGRALVYQYTTHPTSACGFEAGRTDIRLVVPQEVAVHGRVIDAETGKPVEGAHVLIHPDNVRDDPANRYLPDRVVSGKDGHFAFKGVPPGRHYINVSTPYDAGYVDQRVRFALRPYQSAWEITVMLKRGGAVEIRAREEGTNTRLGLAAMHGDR